jgi:hypothetical protein
VSEPVPPAPGEPSEPDPSQPPLWEPANAAEQELAEAVQAGAQEDYFRIVGTVDLFLPQYLSAEPTEGQRFLTMDILGHPFLPVFTSFQALAAGVGALVDGYTTTNYPELRRKWPNPAWRLAINPGTPIDAYVEIEAVAAVAVGDITLPTMVEAILDEAAAQKDTEDEAEPYVDVDAALTEAAEAGDGEAYLRALADAVVIVPIAEPVEDASALLDEDFPWRIGGTPEQPAIDVFTSRQLFEHAYPAGTPHLEAALAFFLTAWPDGYAMTVNPGARMGVVVPAEHVLTLLFSPDDEDLEA